jgi:hypothetical protein
MGNRKVRKGASSNPHRNPHREFGAHVDVQQSERVAHNVFDPMLL